MELTAEQQQAIQNGQAVTVTVGGAPCVLVRKDVFDRGEEVDLQSVDKRGNGLAGRRSN